MQHMNFEEFVKLSLSKHYKIFKIQQNVNFDKPAYRRQAQFDILLNFEKTLLFNYPHQFIF